MDDAESRKSLASAEMGVTLRLKIRVRILLSGDKSDESGVCCVTLSLTSMLRDEYLTSPATVSAISNL